MELCYLTNDHNNALRLSSIMLGYTIDDYEKVGNTIYPLDSDGNRIYGTCHNTIDNVILGNDMVVTSMLELYKNDEIKQIEFELFCDLILRQGENDLFKRVGINFSCKNTALGNIILSMIDDVKDKFEEIVLEYPMDNTTDIILNHPILHKYYIGQVDGDGISWYIFDKVREDYIDMTVLDMIMSPEDLMYKLSDILTSTNYDQERFIYAYEIITGRLDPYLRAYDGFRVVSKNTLTDIQPILTKLKRVMGEFTVINRSSIIDALRVKYYYRQYSTRIFKSKDEYCILIHAFVSPNIDVKSVDQYIKEDLLNNLKSCKNDEELVSLDKFNTLDLEELVHIIPHKEDGSVFCLSDDYDLELNPYTRRPLDKNDVIKHYYHLFTM